MYFNNLLFLRCASIIPNRFFGINSSKGDLCMKKLCYWAEFRLKSWKEVFFVRYKFSINLWCKTSIYKIFHFEKSINQLLNQCLAEVDNTITSSSMLLLEIHQLENHVSYSGLQMINSMKTTWLPSELISDSKLSIPIVKISNYKSGILLDNKDSERLLTLTTKV